MAGLLVMVIVLGLLGLSVALLWKRKPGGRIVPFASPGARSGSVASWRHPRRNSRCPKKTNTPWRCSNTYPNLDQEAR